MPILISFAIISTKYSIDGRIEMKRGKKEEIVTINKKAYHDYRIEETYEAGISLLGTEVKSIREGGINIRDGYAAVEDGEVFLHCHISPYRGGNIYNHEPDRKRKLLLHKREINRLLGKTAQKGYTLIPLKVYFKNGRVKVEIGVARGKKLYDKREDIKKKEALREIDRAVKERHRGT